jgi:hypothetical protein
VPKEVNLTKAILEEIGWTEQGKVKEVDDPKTLTVQFNPQTLKVSFSNQKSGGDQAGGSAIQFVGQGTTALSLELWFDVTVLPAEQQQRINDVRLLTHDVAYFIMPKEENRQQGGDNGAQFIPPGVRFSWGSFLFEGVMDSMDESLEFFSEDGRPLRASVSIKLSRQEILFRRPQEGQAGTQAQQAARAGDSVQKMASDAGRPQDWKAIAAANGIEKPRQWAPGTMVNLNAGASLGAGFSSSLGASLPVVTASAGLSSSAGLSASAGLSSSAGLSGSAGLSSNVGLSSSAGLSTSAGSSAGAGLSGNVGLGGSVGLSFDATRTRR